MRPFVVAGGGFLLAVLWFDLMFDMQVRGGVTEEALASIASYYRRVTTEARPMNRLVATVMLAMLGSLVAELAIGRGPHWPGWVCLVMVGGAVGLAGARTLRLAVRLGRQADSAAVQAALARSIFGDHLLCLAAIGSTLVVQLAWAR